MAIVKRQLESNAKWYTLMWGQSKKHENLPYPNLKHWNKETKTEEFTIAPGETPSFSVEGVITYIGYHTRPSFNDRKQNTGEENQINMFVNLRDANGEEVVITTPIMSNEKPYEPAKYLIAQLHKLVQTTPSDAFVSIDFFRPKDSDYSRSSINVSTGMDENGKPIFVRGTENRIFVDKEDRPPLNQDMPDLKDINGNVILREDGNPMKDKKMLYDWTVKTFSVLLQHYKKDDAESEEYQKQAKENLSDESDEDLDMDTAAAELAQHHEETRETARMR